MSGEDTLLQDCFYEIPFIFVLKGEVQCQNIWFMSQANYGWWGGTRKNNRKEHVCRAGHPEEGGCPGNSTAFLGHMSFPELPLPGSTLPGITGDSRWQKERDEKARVPRKGDLLSFCPVLLSWQLRQET